jgi:hypothetical protein
MGEEMQMISPARKKQLREATKKRMENCQARQPKGMRWEARRVKIKRLFRNNLGEWMVELVGGNPMPATDVEVSLWVELEEMRERIEGLEQNRI